MIDHLKDKLQGPLPEKEQIDILNQLAYEYYQVDIEKTFEYCRKALDQAKAIDYQKGIAQASKYLAIGHIVRKNFLQAIELDQVALSIAREIDEQKLIAQTLNSLGLSYESLGFTEKAITHYFEALEYAQRNPDDRMTCFIYRNLGYLHDHLGEEQKAINFFNKSAEVAKQSDHHMIKYIPDLNLGNYYIKNNQFNKALNHLNSSYQLCSNNYAKATVLNTISNLYEKQGKWELAEDYQNKAIAVIEASGNRDQLEDIQLSLAQTLIHQKKFHETISLLCEVSENKNDNTSYSFNDKKRHQLLAQSYHQVQDYSNAIVNYQKLIGIQDSLYDRGKLELTAKLEAKFRIQEKENENAYLRAEQEQNRIILAQQNRTTNYIILLALLISIIALLLFKAYRDNKLFNQKLQKQVAIQTKALKNTNAQLKHSNIELERFAFIASHDLKEPLRNISNFSSLLETKLSAIKDKPPIKDYLHFIKTNAVQMNDLIEDVLEYSRVNGDRNTYTNETNLKKLINQVEQSLISEIEQDQVTLVIDQASPNFFTIESHLFLVLKNLISNGIKYNTSPQKEIHVSYQDLDNYHQFCVQDNGIGISPKYKDQIFEMFKRLHNRDKYEGTGLGLAICKKIITNLGGQIWFESSGLGSQFYFTIPK